MKRIVSAFGFAAVSVAAVAQTAPAPQLVVGDKWVYQFKHEQPGQQAQLTRIENTVERTGVRNLLLEIQPVDGSLPKREQFVSADWSEAMAIAGKEVIVHKPFEFPLEPAKTWKIEWEDPNGLGRVKLERDELVYRVAGWETVTVPAGTFRALKIEAEGTWYREFHPQGPAATASVSQGVAGSVGTAITRKPFTPVPETGRIYETWWYAPEAKRDVKSFLERVAPDGRLLVRNSRELEKFTAGQ